MTVIPIPLKMYAEVNMLSGSQDDNVMSIVDSPCMMDLTSVECTSSFIDDNSSSGVLIGRITYYGMFIMIILSVLTFGWRKCNFQLMIQLVMVTWE